MKKSDFKNSSGTFYTKSLFLETNVLDKSTSVYTLKDEPYAGLPSLKEKYFESGDLSGYVLSQEYLGGWSHLQKLRELDWFNAYWDKWEKELEVKIRAEALVRLYNVSKDKDSNKYVDMNKFFLEKGWVLPEDRKPSKRRGAPSKAEIKEQATLIAKEDEMLASDLRRVLERPLN